VSRPSPRLQEIVDALPLRPGLRVLEIGCGPGAAARAVAERVGPTGRVLAIDRSARAIEKLLASGPALIEAGVLTARVAAVEHLELEPGEAPYHVAFAIRVGVLDGRHPDRTEQALDRIARALVADGRLFIDGGDPLRELTVPGVARTTTPST
jgi:SAM-dependent methyltransferase